MILSQEIKIKKMIIKIKKMIFKKEKVFFKEKREKGGEKWFINIPLCKTRDSLS
ncbi:hypothetical protein NBO_3g0050 [Nosema bombycis CQ1]|uniref:Uncharacterized protein n=1 Tax=Nosema bombycis (strain CQ1 / CVCC 102059) TaxID=578461 RepID=R0MC11_NOSB1|nr:hypothetical protein NBO_3g0050 [Nosema bombycis CQ1]|eukprot:EOB15499.1 hypothetical protein NBO_3g0050 [Nosema bombycis CQ1]